MKPSSLVGLFILTLGMAACLNAQTTLRFAGATTLEKSIRPFAAAVGKVHNVTLELVPNGAGRGLEDLVSGRAQAAMFAGSLANFAAQINEKTPGSIDPAKLEVFPLFEMPAIIIVHKSNSTAALTHEQIRGLLSGKVVNWKEVGGPDLPVIVVIPGPSDGIRSVITEKVMQGAAYAASARVLQTAPDMNKVVAQLPGAVAFMSEKNTSAEVRVIKPTQPIQVPFSLITVGAPTEPLKSVIADLEARLK